MVLTAIAPLASSASRALRGERGPTALSRKFAALSSVSSLLTCGARCVPGTQVVAAE